MKARHRAHAPLKTVELCKQDGAHPKQLLPDGLKVRMPLHQLFDASGKICPRGLADLQPEATQNSAQAVLEVQQLALHQLARRQHRADLLGRDRLAVDRRNQPSRISCAILRASLRSVFTGIALKASLTCRVSRSSTARPACFMAA